MTFLLFTGFILSITSSQVKSIGGFLKTLYMSVSIGIGNNILIFRNSRVISPPFESLPADGAQRGKVGGNA